MADNSPDVPSYMSQRRAAALAGVSRKLLASKINAGVVLVHGEFKQVARADLERLIGRSLTRADWDRVTVEMNRAGMTAEAA